MSRIFLDDAQGTRCGSGYWIKASCMQGMCLNLSSQWSLLFKIFMKWEKNESLLRDSTNGCLTTFTIFYILFANEPDSISCKICHNRHYIYGYKYIKSVITICILYILSTIWPNGLRWNHLLTNNLKAYKQRSWDADANFWVYYIHQDLVLAWNPTYFCSALASIKEIEEPSNQVSPLASFCQNFESRKGVCDTASSPLPSISSLQIQAVVHQR